MRLSRVVWAAESARSLAGFPDVLLWSAQTNGPPVRHGVIPQAIPDSTRHHKRKGNLLDPIL